jgi:hypothetical protein
MPMDLTSLRNCSDAVRRKKVSLAEKQMSRFPPKYCVTYSNAFQNSQWRNTYMKKQLIAVMFALVISLAINASQASAQSQAFRVNVPFDFSANNKTLQAGTYMVNPATDNRIIWRIQNAEQSLRAVLLANPSNAGEPENIRITFRRYGERYFLIGFKTTSYEVSLPMSGSEKNFRRSAGINLAKLITLEAK